MEEPRSTKGAKKKMHTTIKRNRLATFIGRWRKSIHGRIAEFPLRRRFWERVVDGSIGAQARRNQEAINNVRSSNTPNSSAASQRDQPRPAGRATISEGCSAIPLSLVFGA